MMAQIGEPHVEVSPQEVVRESSRMRASHPHVVVRERAVDEERGGAPVAIRPQTMQGELDAVRRDDCPLTHA
jgi:hypothetical protein